MLCACAHICRYTRTLTDCTLLTYLGLLPHEEHRPSTPLRQLTQLWAVFPSSFLEWPLLSSSASVSLRHVFLGLPLFLFPCGFQVRACLVMLLAGFLRVWPIPPHFILWICAAMCTCIYSHKQLPIHIQWSTHTYIHTCMHMHILTVTHCHLTQCSIHIIVQILDNMQC